MGPAKTIRAFTLLDLAQNVIQALHDRSYFFTIAIEIDEFVIHIRDQGTPADVAKIQGRKLEELRPGGLGVVLLHKVFHQVNYEPQTCGTILTLRKKIA